MSQSSNRLVGFVQSELNRKYGVGLKVDGISGRKTMDALNMVSALPSTWPAKRKFIGFIQYLTHITSIEDIAVDGLWGPMTQNAFEELMELRTTGKVRAWRDDLDSQSDEFAHFKRIVNTKDESRVDWPEERDLEQYYGPVGTSWVKMKTPFPMKLAWQLDRTINSFSVHQKVRPHLFNALEEIADVYSMSEIEDLGLNVFSGCANVRKIRGGKRFSSHSYAVSVDIDNLNNRLRWGKNRAKLARPEFEKFWTAIYRNGGKSLGIESALAGRYNGNGYDFQHFGWYHYKL